MDLLLLLVPIEQRFRALLLFLIGTVELNHHPLIGLALHAPLTLAGRTQQAFLQFLRHVGQRSGRYVLYERRLGIISCRL